MEFNPVVNDNGALSFEASQELTNALASLQGQVVRVIFTVWFMALLGLLKLFNVQRQFNLAVVLFGIAIAIVAAWGTQYQFNKIRSAVTKIARRVYITEELVSIIPFTFGVFFWNKKSLHHIDFKINELKIRKTDNPVRFKSAFDNRVFEIRDKNTKAYIVFDYFDQAMKQRMTEIQVEVTPPELLLPGRLRHY